MKIEELKQKGNVTVTEVKNGCVKVSADKGFILKGDDTYTSEIYCDKDAELQGYEVVAYSYYLRAENKKKYEGKTLEEAKEMLLAEIDAYDTSSAVNGFALNDKQRWLDVDLRRSLSYSTNILKEDGEKTVDIWFDTECETMDIDNALHMLKELEVYAKQTNNVTHRHKAEVMALTSIGEVEAYDVTKGYPEKLVFSF